MYPRAPECEATPPRGAGMLVVAGPESGPGDSRAPTPRHPGHICTVPTVYLHCRVSYLQRTYSVSTLQGVTKYYKVRL